MSKAPTETKPVFAELSEDGKYIEVYFKPEPKLISAMHRLNAKFQNKDKVDVPHWRVGLDFESARQLVVFVSRDKLQLGDALMAWGQRKKEVDDGVVEILNTHDPELERMPELLPELHEFMRDYQHQGVAYSAFVDHPLIADQPGLGKTIEAIGAIYEAGNQDGPNLVVAPLTSIQVVWEYELRRWTDMPVFIGAAEGTGRLKREMVLREIELMLDRGWPFWLLVNPEMVRMKKKDRGAGTAKDNLVAEYPLLHEIEWANIIADEVHKKGLRNNTSVTAVGFYDLKTRENGKRIALSGTPVGGKPINMFGILHWLDPIQFPSKWKWAERWMELSSNGYGTEVGAVKEDLTDEFDRHLRSVVIRRTKEEVIKELPPKDSHDIWAEMTDDQAEQYRRFAEMATVELGDETLSATSILAIYTRLKQFASAKCMFSEDGKLVPTQESGKLQVLEEKLEELGIMDGSSEAQALVFTQFKEMADMVTAYLTDKGVPVVTITGATKDRAGVVGSFQEGDAKVCVMTTTSGGVSITMDKADTVFILDETWNPDDQEQAEDRAHRASRIHQVTVYYVRTKGTLEEYIKQVTDRKGAINKWVLDERRIRLY